MVNPSNRPSSRAMRWRKSEVSRWTSRLSAPCSEITDPSMAIRPHARSACIAAAVISLPVVRVLPVGSDSRLLVTLANATAVRTTGRLEPMMHASVLHVSRLHVPERKQRHAAAARSHATIEARTKRAHRGCWTRVQILANQYPVVLRLSTRPAATDTSSIRPTSPIGRT